MRILIITLTLLPLAAHGTIVTTATDEDDGSLAGGTGISLREAVKYSAAGDTVTFAATLSGQTIRLTLGEMLISQSLTISAFALAERVVLSGDRTGDGRTADDTRVINLTNGNVCLDSLIITGGNCPAAAAATQGAGIYVNSTTTRLTVRNSTLTSNHASGGAGIYFSGLVNSPGSFLLLQNSTFTGNTATNGGGIYIRESTAKIECCRFSGNSATGDGGAIWNRLALDLTASTLTGNSAQRGGGIYNFTGTFTVATSTLSDNSASELGGGIYTLSGPATVKNSTLTGNSAGDSGGGIYSVSGALVLQHATVTRNSSVYGAGINSSGCSLTSTIVAGNLGESPANISGPASGPNKITSGDPLLAPLGDYGGPTQTMPPLPGSPAINAGGITTLVTDQRGFPRAGSADIGAAEYLKPPDYPALWNVDSDGDGAPFGLEQALGTHNAIPDSASMRNLSGPVINAFGHASLSFGLDGAAVAGTRWVLRRSGDLSAGSFVEIYRYDGVSDTVAPGINFVRSTSAITVTDTTTSNAASFYRFEALLEP